MTTEVYADFQDARPLEPSSLTATAIFQGRMPPCQYVVLRGGSAQPERFNANNDEEALARLQKEVRAGQTTVVYCYKLFCAEEFVRSSRTVTGDELAGLTYTVTPPNAVNLVT